MAKFRKLLKGLKLLMYRPYLINAVIEHPDVYRYEFNKKYGAHYKEGLKYIDIQLFFNNESIKVSPYSYLEGSSLPTDFALLIGLCEKYTVNDYLEIGTWRGASAANIAQYVKNCYTLNLPDETIKSQGGSDNYVNSHRFFSKSIGNITHLFGDSTQFDFEKLNTKFDLIFVDGDHSYSAVKKDTATVFKLLKNDKSIIVWHDYAFSPEDVRYEVLMGILDGCPEDKRKHLYHVSNTKCAIYLPYGYTAKTLERYALPEKYFEVNLTIKPVSK